MMNVIHMVQQTLGYEDIVIDRILTVRFRDGDEAPVFDLFRNPQTIMRRWLTDRHDRFPVLLDRVRPLSVPHSIRSFTTP